jgi:DNA-binding CsgD family transcriptional regulator
MFWEISCLLEVGFLDSAARNVNRYGQIAQEMHSAKRRADGALMQAMLAHLRGDCRSALELASKALQLGREAGYADAEIHYVAQLADFADETELIDTSARDLIRDHEPWLRSPSRRALLAFLHGRLGHADEAERLIGDLASDDFHSVPRDWMWLPLMKMLCESIARLGRADWAAVVYGLLVPYADQFIVNSNSVCYGSVQLWLGVAAATAGMPEAVQHLQRAVECNEGAGAYVWGARSREELGRLLLECGDAEQGQDLASAAARAYQEFGLVHSAERAAALLFTAAPVANRPSLPSGLTGREVEVLRLIAGGRSNKEIADQLFLSVRTVERHITNLYAKIDAHGKADAAAFAIRHHLID